MTAAVASKARIPMLASSQNPDRVLNILRSSVVAIRASGIRWCGAVVLSWLADTVSSVVT